MKGLFTSLMFERGHGWSGLLVEPHPLIFAQVTLLKIIFEGSTSKKNLVKVRLPERKSLQR